jgi:pyrroloquinoline quinone (PQQ) biosynthesis protein C
MDNELEKLAMSCLNHPALNNRFYDLWRNHRLNADQVEVVATNFYHHVAPTSERLSALLLVLPSEAIRARSETVDNINDELGRGDPLQAHTRLLETFFDSLLSKLRSAPTRLTDIQTPLLPSTRQLIDEGYALFAGDVHRAIGALLAQEWHAYPQLIHLYEGARNYMDLYNLVEFHGVCDFFYIHIGGAEQEHMRHSLSTAASMCRDRSDLNQIEAGLNAYLTLLATYWNSLYEAVVSRSEPTTWVG